MDTVRFPRPQSRWMSPLALLAMAAALLAPLAAQSTFDGSAALDRAIEEAIQRDQIPGAVLLVSHKGQVVHRKA